MSAAARKRGFGIDPKPIAVLDRSRGAGTPREHASGVVPPDLIGDLIVEKRRRHRAAVRLAQAPRGASVVLRDFLDDGGEIRWAQLRSSEAFFQEHAKELSLVQPLEQVARQAAVLLYRLRGGVDARGELANSLEVGVA